MKKLLFSALAICVLFAACKPNDNGGASVKTRKDSLSTGKWRMTAITATGAFPITGRDTTLDLFESFDSCAKDDRYIFQTDGKITNDQGTAKCFMTEPQQMDGGTWSLNAAMDTLEMKDGTLPGRFRITAFRNGSMKLQKDTAYLIFPMQLEATLTQEN